MTDGKPNDFDQYEGRYGVEDVRQALREAGASGVAAFGLAIEGGTSRQFGAMFGAGRYGALADPRDLPAAVANLLGKTIR